MAAVGDDVERNRNEWTPWRGRRVSVVVGVRRWEDDGGAGLAPSAEANRRPLPDRCSLVGPTRFCPLRSDPAAVALVPSPIPRRRCVPTCRPAGANANAGLCETRRTIAMVFDVVLNPVQSVCRPLREVNWTPRHSAMRLGFGSEKGRARRWCWPLDDLSFVCCRPGSVSQSQCPVSTLPKSAKEAMATSGGEDDESLGSRSRLVVRARGRRTLYLFDSWPLAGTKTTSKGN